MPAPSPVDQLAFLRDLQKLLDEGQFTATCKFALLLALAELAVERGDDTGDALPLPLALIAERFVSLYWGHARPFPASMAESGPALLSQNLGQNIALLREIAALQRHCPRLAQARAHRQWVPLVAQAARIIQVMPHFKLQTLRREARPFLQWGGKIHPPFLSDNRPGRHPLRTRGRVCNPNNAKSAHGVQEVLCPDLCGMDKIVVCQLTPDGDRRNGEMLPGVVTSLG